MATIDELRSRLTESQGMKSDKRIVVLEKIYAEVSAIESLAVRDAFVVPIDQIRALRAFLPDLEAAINRAKAGIKRMNPV